MDSQETGGKEKMLSGCGVGEKFRQIPHGVSMI